MKLRVYNHSKGVKEEFEPLRPGTVSMYVCGMTPQDRPHMGHMLAFVSADLVRRTLEYFGYSVLHIQNFTDIDDKIIEKANATGRDAHELARTNMQRYFDAADSLGIRRASRYPLVTEHIQDIIAYIQRIVDAGHAYAAGGNVWFAVRSYPPYGRLSGRSVDELRASGRVEADPSKRDPLDFALWKAAKSGEPAWDSAFGPGRPGWHIECSVMATKYLGDTFDLHGGGRDLLFPHHENEVAQSCSLGGQYVRYWMHNGLLTLDGQKMSKSTGHFFGMDEVLAEFPGEVVRFYLMRGHFRNQMEFSRERLQEASAAYERLQRALLQLEEAVADPALGTGLPPGVTSPEGVALAEAAEQALIKFMEGLADDFNGEAALAALFELIRLANPFLVGRSRPAAMDAQPVRRALAVLREGLSVLGLFGSLPVREAIPPEIQDLVTQRDQARRARDFRRADELRALLQEQGFRVEDNPTGTRVRRV